MKGNVAVVVVAFVFGVVRCSVRREAQRRLGEVLLLLPRLMDAVVADLCLGRGVATEWTLRVHLENVVATDVIVGIDAHVGALAISIVLFVFLVRAGCDGWEVTLVAGTHGFGEVAGGAQRCLHNVIGTGHTGRWAIGIEVNIGQTLLGAHAVSGGVNGIDKVGITASQTAQLVVGLGEQLGGIQTGDAAQLVSGLACVLATGDAGNVGSRSLANQMDGLLGYVHLVGQLHQTVANHLADALNIQGSVFLEIIDQIAEGDHNQIARGLIILILVLLATLLLLLLLLAARSLLVVVVLAGIGLQVVALLIGLDQFAVGLVHIVPAGGQTLNENGHLVVTEVRLTLDGLHKVVQVELDFLATFADNVTLDLARFRHILLLEHAVELSQVVCQEVEEVAKD